MRAEIRSRKKIRDISATDLKVEVMALDPRGIPQPTGVYETLQADSVILALGQQAESAFLTGIPGIETKADGIVVVDAAMMTGHPGIFAGGDVIPSGRTVTISVGHGKKAARYIDGWLRHTP